MVQPEHRGEAAFGEQGKGRARCRTVASNVLAPPLGAGIGLVVVGDGRLAGAAGIAEQSAGAGLGVVDHGNHVLQQRRGHSACRDAREDAHVRVDHEHRAKLEAARLDRDLAGALEHFLRRLRPQDRLVSRTERGVHAGELHGLPLAALTLGDVAADSAVAFERAGGVEHRLAAKRDPDRAGVGPRPLHLEVVKRLVALELGAVPRPVLFGQVERRLVPALAAKVGSGVKAGVLDRRHEGEAELLILLPVPVRGKRGQAAETLLAFAHRLVRGDALADVSRDRCNDPTRARAQHAPRRFEGQPRAVLASVVAFHPADRRRVGDHLIVSALEFLA